MAENRLDRLARVIAGTRRSPATARASAPDPEARSRRELLSAGAKPALQHVRVPPYVTLAADLPARFSRCAVLRAAGVLGLSGSLAATLARPRSARAADPCTKACEENVYENYRRGLRTCIGTTNFKRTIASLWIPSQALVIPACAVTNIIMATGSRGLCHTLDLRDAQGNCLYDGPNPPPPPGPQVPSSFPPPKGPSGGPDPKAGCGGNPCSKGSICCADSTSDTGFTCCAVGCAKNGRGCCSSDSDC